MKTMNVNVPSKGKAEFRQFSGMADLSRLLHENKDNVYFAPDGYDFACSTREQTLTSVSRGDIKLADKAAKMMRHFKEVQEIPSKKKVKRRSVAGGYVNVAAAYAGHPEICRIKRRVEVNNAPLTVIFDCAVSVGVNAETIMRRGAAALTLVQLLAANRPVSLYVVAGMNPSGVGNRLISVKMPTDPIDLGRVAWALCSPAMLRHAMFISSGAHIRDIQWAFNDYRWQQEHLGEFMGAMLGEGETLNIPGTHLFDGPFSSDQAAVEWVKKLIEEYRS